MMYRRLVPLLALFMLAGCGGGAPTTYLTLSAQTSQRSYVASGAPIAVADVSIPPDLDRASYTTMASNNQLQVSPNARWAAPLGGLIQRALANDFANILTGTTVVLPGDQVPSGPTRLVQVNVQKFVADKTGRVMLIAQWAVTATKHNKTLAQDLVHITVPGRSDPVSEAHTMSIALAQMAGQIAGRL